MPYLPDEPDHDLFRFQLSFQRIAMLIKTTQGQLVLLSKYSTSETESHLWPELDFVHNLDNIADAIS